MPPCNTGNVSSLWTAPQGTKLGSGALSGENFVEYPETPETWVLYNHSRQTLLGAIIAWFLLWGIWLAYTGLLIYAFNAGYDHGIYRMGFTIRLVSAGAFGIFVAWFTYATFPQTLIITKGALEGCHILGFGRLVIRRRIPIQKIRGLSLDFIQAGGRGEGSYVRHCVTWAGTGARLVFGLYQDNDLAKARIVSISERTGLPIVAIRLQPGERLGLRSNEPRVLDRLR